MPVECHCWSRRGICCALGPVQQAGTSEKPGRARSGHMRQNHGLGPQERVTQNTSVLENRKKGRQKTSKPKWTCQRTQNRKKHLKGRWDSEKALTRDAVGAPEEGRDTGRSTIPRNYGCTFTQTDERYHSAGVRSPVDLQQENDKDCHTSAQQRKTDASQSHSQSGGKRHIIPQGAARARPRTTRRPSPGLRALTDPTPSERETRAAAGRSGNSGSALRQERRPRKAEEKQPDS